MSSHVVPDKRQNSERPEKIRQFAITIKSIASLNITLLYFAHYPNQLMRSSPLTIERLKHVGVISGKIMEKQFSRAEQRRLFVKSSKRINYKPTLGKVVFIF